MALGIGNIKKQEEWAGVAENGKQAKADRMPTIFGNHLAILTIPIHAPA